MIWLPTYVLWLAWQDGWRRTFWISLVSLGLGLLISWLLYTPFGGWQTLPRMLHERTLYLANSPWQVLNYLLVKEWGVALKAGNWLTVQLPTLLFVSSALLAPMWIFNFRPKRWRNPELKFQPPGKADDQILWTSLLTVSLLFLLIGSYWFQHWYILWVVWPAASAVKQSIYPICAALAGIWRPIGEFWHGFYPGNAAQNKTRPV